MATKAKTAEVDDDVELDELDEDVEEATEAKDDEVTFGVSDLCKYLQTTLNLPKPIKPRDLRTLIRKMAREKNPRVNREITAGNRTRYDWPDGPEDPEVKAIIAAVKGGELEAGKREALQKLKDRKKDQKATEGDGKGKAKGKTKITIVEDEDEGDDVLEDDE